MADLDDFFAKKDRKKSKSVKKFATADELAKKLEDTKQKTDVRPKKERPVQEGEETGRPGEEEEWKDYEEPVKDYTGLKIQVLQGNAGAQESGRDSSAEDSAPENTKNKGPWNKPVEVEQAAAPPPPPPEEKPKSQPSTYVPPQSRNRDVEPVRRHQSKNAPDIHNDDYFPRAPAPCVSRWRSATATLPCRTTASQVKVSFARRSSKVKCQYGLVSKARRIANFYTIINTNKNNGALPELI